MWKLSASGLTLSHTIRGHEDFIHPPRIVSQCRTFNGRFLISPRKPAHQRLGGYFTKLELIRFPSEYRTTLILLSCGVLNADNSQSIGQILYSPCLHSAQALLRFLETWGTIVWSIPRDTHQARPHLNLRAKTVVILCGARQRPGIFCTVTSCDIYKENRQPHSFGEAGEISNPMDHVTLKAYNVRVVSVGYGMVEVKVESNGTRPIQERPMAVEMEEEIILHPTQVSPASSLSSDL